MFALKRLAVALAGAATLVACSDALSPDTVDPQALNASVNTLASTFDNNAAFQSLRTLAPSFPSYNVTRLVRASVAALGVGVHRSDTRDLEDARRLLAAVRGPAGIHALFPSDVLGKTLVWDTANGGSYVVSAIAGAPANGIRIVLYVADPSTGKPFVPLQPIGNLDLTDESTPAANKLGVLLRLGGLTIADYDITAVIGTISASISAKGFVRSGDGTQQANFDITVAVTPAALSVHVVITGSDGTTIDATASVSGVNGTIDFAVSRDHNTIAIHIVQPVGSDSITGTIRFNGTVVATMSGLANDPTIVAAEGFPLSTADLASLVQLFQKLGEFVGAFLEGVFAPAGIVFGKSVGITAPMAR